MKRLIGTLPWVILLAVCGRAAATTKPVPVSTARPNVVLITLDTTRADRMGFLGSERGLTPNLDALARESVVFSRAYAQVPLTTPSHAVILTGTYPQFNHVNYMGDPLAETLPFLPEIFHKTGYKTAAFVGALALEPKSVAPGFERGFDVYDAGFHRRHPGEDRYHSLERRAEDVVARALAWLAKKPAGPFFLWIHLYDPHDPYTPPEPFQTRYASEPYDGEIAYTDFSVSKLLAGLKALSVFDSSLIAVMADHGEAFGEHGENHHGIFLYDETVRVPLLLKLANKQSAKKIETKVGLVDVAPTILQAAALPIPSAMQGESLLRFLKSGSEGSANQAADPSAHAVYSESDYGHRSFGWSMLRAWRAGKYLYVDAPERELYDQAADPQAAHNLAADAKAVADTAAAQMTEFVNKTREGSSSLTKLSMEQSESLHALGYMGSDTKPSGQTDQNGGPDPKQKIGIANRLYDALVDTENGRYQEAVPILEQILKDEPNTLMASLQLGRSYVALKQYQKAIPPLEVLLAKTPDNAFAHYELGCALVKTGRWADAAPHFEVAVSQLTTSPMMHFYLALVYQRTSRSDEAVKEFQDALHLSPNHFPANLFLGRMLISQQKAAEALPYLNKAASLHPDSIDAHGVLAEAYTQLGQAANASREQAEAERIASHGGTRLGTPTVEDSAGTPQR